jgi:hypothetical protein
LLTIAAKINDLLSCCQYGRCRRMGPGSRAAADLSGLEDLLSNRPLAPAEYAQAATK